MEPVPTHLTVTNDAQSNYDTYLEKYAAKHNIPQSEAAEHKLVKEVRNYYFFEQANK